MIEKALSTMLKKYVSIFLSEYQNYLNSDMLYTLKNIKYQDIICIKELSIPFGTINLGKIYLSNVSNELINNIQNMDGYNSKKYKLNNNNLSSYVQYMCENGYNLLDYFSDILMYFVFKMVIKEDSGFINGLINQEIRFLSIKYSFKCANLYAKEEKIVERVTKILKIDTTRRILFMDKVTRFKYLNEEKGYKYALMVEEVEKLINEKYQDLEQKEYNGLNGFINYTEDYDKLAYGNVYNYLLDFEVGNSL